ncbi:MAG: tRNA lysidine(34) synthetase TilS [Candidatus Aureabacteria bacterium]|nr:tRNA lysidine(34) synthetase TilS [Candidatus Auribacterota bacterium]
MRKLVGLRDFRKFFSDGEKVVVGFSSGPDSVFLVKLLLAYSGTLGLKICIAHLNHCLRGKESDSDELFARKFAQRHELQFYSERVNIKEEKAVKKIGLEEAARNVRYNFFKRACCSFGAVKLALAHNFDDVVETGLMRILKGTSVEGLSSISSRRKLGRIFIVRPLLALEKAKIIKYLNAGGEKFRIDRSNYDTGILRNSIRRKLLPHIRKTYNPRVDAALARLFENASLVSDFIREKGRKLLRSSVKPGGINVDCGKWRRENTAVVMAAAKMLLLDLGIDPKKVTSKAVHSVVQISLSQEGKKAFKLAGTLFVKEGNSLLIKGEGDQIREYKEKKLLLGRKYITEAILVETEILDMSRSVIKAAEKHFSSHKDFNFQNGFLTDVQFFDAGLSGSKIILTTVKKGRSYNPTGFKGRKKLQDILVDAKVPFSIRVNLPVFSNGKGDLIFLAGYRIADKFKLTEKTSRVGKIKLKIKIAG